jgi:hypothetical protein
MLPLFASLTVPVLFFLLLHENNAFGKTYKIGGKGPGGGIVFYDKGKVTDGWRYLEVSPEDLGEVNWGCYDKSIPGATGIETGKGRINTAAIMKGCPGNKTAAFVAASYTGGGENDWYLPSKDELDLIYNNLIKKKIDDSMYNIYWSSSEPVEYGKTLAWSQDFGSGSQQTSMKYCAFLVRAVRAF